RSWSGHVAGDDPAERSRGVGGDGGDGDGDAEADEEGTGGEPEERAASSYEGESEGGDGDELGPEHHGTDDEDLRVDDDGDAREEGRKRHEGQVGPVELGFVVGALGDVGPHDGVGAGAGGVAFGVESGPGDP